MQRTRREGTINVASAEALGPVFARPIAYAEITVEAGAPHAQALLDGVAETIELFYGEVVEARLVEEPLDTPRGEPEDGAERHPPVDVDAARHELWRHLNGYVSHLPEDDPDWGAWTEAILLAARTGRSTPPLR